MISTIFLATSVTKKLDHNNKKNDNNLVYLEVAQDVVLEYMKKHQLPKDWLDIYTADDTMDFFDYAKDSIVGIYPA